MCLKREKKQHMWDKGEETYIIYIYIYQEVQECM